MVVVGAPGKTYPALPNPQLIAWQRLALVRLLPFVVVFSQTPRKNVKLSRMLTLGPIMLTVDWLGRRQAVVLPGVLEILG